MGMLQSSMLIPNTVDADCVFSALGDGVPVIDVRRRAQLSTAGSDSTSASFLNCWFQVCISKLLNPSERFAPS